MSSSPSQGAPSWLRFGIPAAIVIAACGFTVYLNSGDPAPEPKPAPAASAGTVFGPGALGTGSSGESLNKEETRQAGGPPGGLMAGADGQLVLNGALHDVFDYYLLQQAGNDQARALQAYLKDKLPPAAAARAQEIAGHYQSYMTAHDALLASQNLASGDAERIAAWRDQRDRLRLDMLEANVVQAWYQEDDNRFAQAIEQLRQRGAEIKPTLADGRSLSNQEQDDNQTLDVIADETKSYAVKRQEEQTWATHFQIYAAAAAQIKQQTGLTFIERENKLRAELVRLFPSEAQRQRARDLGP
jgi:hypothetical protein